MNSLEAVKIGATVLLVKSSGTNDEYGAPRPDGIPTRTLHSKRVEDYILERNRRKKDKTIVNNWRMPAVSAGMIGAGAGLYALGAKGLSKEDKIALENFQSMEDRLGPAKWWNPTYDRGLAKNIKGSPEAFYDYIDKASVGVRIKPWGKLSIADIMGKGVKPLMGSLSRLSGKENHYDKTQRAEKIMDKDHYPSFERGPSDAYLHQIEKKLVENRNNVNNFLFGGTKYEGRVHDKGEDGGELLDTFWSRLKKGYDEFLGEYGAGIGVSGLNSGNATKLLNHGQQMDAIRGFQGWVMARDKDLAGLKSNIEGKLTDSQTWASSQYVMASKLLSAIGSKIPKGVGLGLAGAGTAGLGYWLGKKLQDKRLKEKSEQERQAKMSQS